MEPYAQVSHLEDLEHVAHNVQYIGPAMVCKWFMVQMTGTVADVENNGMREQETGGIRDNCAFLNDLTSERQLYNSKCCSGDS